MKKLLLGLIVFGFFFQVGEAQEVLEQYVDSALTNNIVLQKKNVALEQAQYALKVAKGMFYPSLDVKADYLSANGGRDIDIPLGDMLNGVYTTLNQLTQSDRFPQLDNRHVNFLPHNFYDAKVRASVPIFNAELIYNKKVNQQKIEMGRYEADIYKRELVENVKKAYYDYRQAAEAIAIYQSSLELAKEGKRVNERLLENGKGLPAYVLRAESEIEEVQAQLTEAKQTSDNAKRHFNFLLNRNQEAQIDTLSLTGHHEDEVVEALHKKPDISQREELETLDEAISLKKNLYKMKKSVFYPTLNGFLDLGSQAEDWKFNDQSRYVMVGLKLNIPLFAGNTNHNKIKQSELAVKEAQLDLERASEQLKLSSYVSKNKLRSAYDNYLSAKKRLKSVKSYKRLIDRGYREGTNSYIETVDARNQLTKAQIKLSINRYKMLKAKAELERETASYTIE